MRKTAFILLGMVLIFVSVAQTQPVQRKITRQEYIEQYKAMAVKEMLLSGVPASITLAQGILESGDGNSLLARKARNHFGIKCHGTWEGDKFYHDDDRKGECFRVYSSVFDSYKDHSDFLKTRQRYADLFTLERTDYKGWAHGLKKAGYATNPKYPQLLIRIIEENDLHQYDGMTEAPEGKQLVDEKQKSEPKKLADESEFSISMGRKIQKHPNRIKFVVARDGDDFETFEELYDVRKWQIKKYNDVDNKHDFQKGEVIFLQPKRNRAKKDYHYVVKGETMRSISQKYGVKLRKLYKKNRMERGTQPEAGQKLWLRKRKPRN
jgi:hypothetical protein